MYRPLHPFGVNLSVAGGVFVIPILVLLTLQFAFALCLFRFMLQLIISLLLLLITIINLLLLVVVNAVVIRRRRRVRARPGGAGGSRGGDFIGGEHGHELLIVKPIKLNMSSGVGLRGCTGGAAFVLHWRLEKCDGVADGSPVGPPPGRREVEELVDPTRVAAGIAVRRSKTRRHLVVVAQVRPVWGHVGNLWR